MTVRINLEKKYLQGSVKYQCATPFSAGGGWGVGDVEASDQIFEREGLIGSQF